MGDVCDEGDDVDGCDDINNEGGDGSCDDDDDDDDDEEVAAKEGPLSVDGDSLSRTTSTRPRSTLKTRHNPHSAWREEKIFVPNSTSASSW